MYGKSTLIETNELAVNLDSVVINLAGRILIEETETEVLLNIHLYQYLLQMHFWKRYRYFLELLIVEINSDAEEFPYN